VDSAGTTIRVNPTTAMKLSASQLPLRVIVELAYEGLDQDPFEAYDPYDFDVSNTALFPVSTHGMSVIYRAGNRVELEISDSDFGFEISGFDANVRTRARLTYELPGDDQSTADAVDEVTPGATDEEAVSSEMETADA